MQPPDLRFIVNRTILKYLVCSSDISRDYLVMLEYFESFGQGIFGDEILSQIIKDFPGELTDELLLVLSPPHLRHLKLTRCSRLSCSGLRQAIAKCHQLQALDFSECIHLLHPTVFCCLKDKAVNLVSLSLENSEVVSDDIVQVTLICCPQLKHLNLSSCRHITDAAFELSGPEIKNESNSTLTTNSLSSKNVILPGSKLTSVDISGCQSLSTTAVKYLASMCGANLRSINLACTGVNCTALLYLAGLNMEEVGRILHDADHALVNSTAVGSYISSDNCSGQLLTSTTDGGPSVMHKQSTKGKDLHLTHLQNVEQMAFSEKNELAMHHEPTSILSEDLQGATSNDSIISETVMDCHGCDETLLNEIELSTLKDAIPSSPKCSICTASEKRLENFSVTESDGESDDSYKTASEEFDVISCFPPPPGEINCYCNETLEAESRCCTEHENSVDGTFSAETRDCESFWNTPAGNSSTSNLLELNESSGKEAHVSNTDTVLCCSQGCQGSIKDVEARHPADLSCEHFREGGGDEEIFEDCFGVESYILNYSKEKAGKKYDACFHQSVDEKSSLGSSYCNTCFSDAKLSCMTAVNENKPGVTFCDKLKQEEVKCVESCNSTERADYCDLECQTVLEKITGVKSDFCIMPCTEMDHKDVKELHVVDDRVGCNFCGKLNILQAVESDCPLKPDVNKTDNGSRHFVHELCQTLSSSSKLWVDEKNSGLGHAIKPCWEDTGFLTPVVPCENVTENKLHTPHSEMEQSNLRSSNFLPSHRKVLQVDDLLQAQIYQPQITSLDISGICYQNKPLGVVCLKVFSRACNRLKNFAVSWTGLDDEMLTYLLKNEKELETLCLVDCENLSSISVSTIPVHCPKLTSFDLKGMCYVTDHGVMALTRKKNIETLSLAEATITDSTLQSIAKGCGEKKVISALTCCTTPLTMPTSTPSLVKTSLQQVSLSFSPQLKVLDLSWCEDLTDSGMSIIANGCPFLQHLSLRQCSASTFTLDALAANGHHMSYLNIAGIDGLTDVALGSLAENMPLLKEIDVSWNSSLSDVGVIALLQCCTKLNKAVLCGLKRITSQPFLAIIGDLGQWFLLEELCRSNRRPLRNVSEGKLALKFCDTETAKSLGDQIPHRSMSYAPSLRQVLLEYSDKVNDDHLSAIVAVCRGTLFVSDYYAQPVEPRWIFK